MLKDLPPLINVFKLIAKSKVGNHHEADDIFKKSNWQDITHEHTGDHPALFPTNKNYKKTNHNQYL